AEGAPEMSEQNIERRKLSEPRRRDTDWTRTDRLTDEEIEAAVRDDPDAAPLLTKGWFEGAEVVEPPGKELISIRLDRDVLDHFRASSRRYQTKINAVLRAYMEREKEVS